MGSLTTVVKQRPVYMRSVVQGFESLHGLSLMLFVGFDVLVESMSVYTRLEFVHYC